MSIAAGWVIVAIIIDVAVVVANAVELTMLFRKRSHLDRIEHLLLSLSLSDFVAGISMFGQDVTQLKNIQQLGKPKMTTTESLWLDGLFIFFVFVSNFHVVMIAAERLVAVVWPMKYPVFEKKKCQVLTISMVWSLAVIFTCACSFLLKAYYEYRIKGKVGFYTMASILLFACISVFVMYLILSVALVIRDREMRELLPQEVKQRVRDLKTTMFCLLIGFSFLVCFFPITLKLFNRKLDHPISNLLVSLNHLLNPFIYFAKIAYEKRRRKFETLSYRSRGSS